MIFYNSVDPTCTDGLQNQDEEGVDCGGVCEACPTCYDGILNQNEESTDCGGECPACRKFQNTHLLIPYFDFVLIYDIKSFVLD